MSAPLYPATPSPRYSAIGCISIDLRALNLAVGKRLSLHIGLTKMRQVAKERSKSFIVSSNDLFTEFEAKDGEEQQADAKSVSVCACILNKKPFLTVLPEYTATRTDSVTIFYRCKAAHRLKAKYHRDSH